MEQSTWAALHAGDVIVGADGDTWGVVLTSQATIFGPFVITLYRLGREVIGYPPADGVVTVVQRADTRAERAAWSVLSDAGIEAEIIGETWESR